MILVEGTLAPAKGHQTPPPFMITLHLARFMPSTEKQAPRISISHHIARRHRTLCKSWVPDPTVKIRPMLLNDARGAAVSANRQPQAPRPLGAPPSQPLVLLPSRWVFMLVRPDGRRHVGDAWFFFSITFDQSQSSSLATTTGVHVLPCATDRDVQYCHPTPKTSCSLPYQISSHRGGE